MQIINYQQMKDIVEKGDVEVINVLSEEQYRKEHIPGSVNIPVDNRDFVQRVEASVGGKDRQVAVYCASYSCSASKKAAEKLEQAGFTQVQCYEGGMQEWQEKARRKAA